MNCKKIVVFWNDTRFVDAFEDNNYYVVCNSYDKFINLDKSVLKEAKGFLVLCELPWDDKSKEISLNEYGGIRLVQRCIRNEMNLKAPVVFASFDEAKTICDKHSDYRIIKTPALKHYFKRLPATPEELTCCLSEANNMTDTELAYTKLIYCDIKGLLIQINHVLEGRNKAEQDKYRKDIEYVLKERFNNDIELMSEYQKTIDLSDFCKTILSRFGTSSNPEDNNSLLYERNHETIRILLLEDEAEQDENVGQFVKYVQAIEQKALIQKEKEICDYKKKVEALKEEVLKYVDIKFKRKVLDLANTIIKNEEKTYDKNHEKKAETLKNKIEELEKIKEGVEIRKEQERLEAEEHVFISKNKSIALEHKAIAIAQEVKDVKKTAIAIAAIAAASMKLAESIEKNELKVEATTLECEATAIKERARALEKKAFTKPLFTITIENNIDNITYDPIHDPLASERKHSLKEFDVVISDIELWDDNNNLVTLGFNVVETMAKVQKSPLYYIVTNVSRSFYDQIKIPYVRRIRLKKEVFGTIESIETFLYGIKEVYDHRKEETKGKVYNSETLFNKLYDFIKEEKGSEFFNDVENKVKEKSLELIKQFLLLFYTKPFPHNYGESENFKRFNENCISMRKYIKSTIGLGNEKLDKNIAEQEKENLDPTAKDIDHFITRLILRRFFLYVRCFIDRYDLMKSFEGYKNNKGLEGIGFSKNDIACRAIGEQYKTLKGESKKERIQSACLSETLLFVTRIPQKTVQQSQDEPEEIHHLSDEEKAFVNALKNSDKPMYPMTKKGISQLAINY